MGLISTALRAAISRVRDRTFSTQIEVLLRQAVSNGAGGETVTWVTTATYGGRLRHARPRDYLETRGGENFPTGLWLAMLPLGAAVDASVRLRGGGLVFSVIGIDAGRSDPLVLIAHCMPLADVS